MLSRVADRCISVLPKVGVRVFTNTNFIPVLHVERLYDDSSFERTLAFVKAYREATNARALLTVMTPIAPMLAIELESQGFSEAAYRERISLLARFSDIGLHGHYLRCSALPCRPAHNYWNETSLIAAQLVRECEWLEQNGLMARRVYSAGWWHLDSSLVRTLGQLGFLMDFSASTARFNDSPAASQVSAFRRSPVVFAHAADQRVGSIWAVSSLGDSPSRSFVARRAILAFPSLLFGTHDGFLSLYSHDWDLCPDAAMKTIWDLKAHGAGFVSIDALVQRRPAAATVHREIPR